MRAPLSCGICLDDPCAASARSGTSAPCASRARRGGQPAPRADRLDQAATENELDALAPLAKLRYWFDANLASKA